MNARLRGAGLLLVVLVACADRREECAALVSKIGASRLAAEARLLKTEVRSQAPATLAEPSWPAGIRELGPQAVRVSSEGVFVQCWKRFVEEEGIFIAFADDPGDFKEGGDPSFTPLAPHVYRYRIKG